MVDSGRHEVTFDGRLVAEACRAPNLSTYTLPRQQQAVDELAAATNGCFRSRRLNTIRIEGNHPAQRPAAGERTEGVSACPRKQR